MKRLFALLLSVLMIAGLLAGCAEGGKENPSTEPATSTEPSSAPSYVAPVEDDDTDYTIELPLVEDTYEFSYWIPGFSFDDFATYNDNYFFQWMEAQTGIHINFIEPPMSSATETFQTMLLSKDYPDFVQNVYSYYSGGPDKAIADKFLLRLNDYVDQYMPNYKAVVYQDETTFIQSISDTGNLWGIHQILDRVQSTADGLGVRQDWLDRAGLKAEDIITMEDIGNTCRAFKEYTYENVGPLFLSDGALSYSACLNGAYNVVSPKFMSNGFINKDGVATYSPLEPGMKAYIGQIAEWYAEGLVNPNYIADAGMYAGEDRWANSEVGIGEFCYTTDRTYAAAAAKSELLPSPDFALTAIPTPRLNATDDLKKDIHVCETVSIVNPGFSLGVTTACSNIELACKWLDVQWTEEGKHAANWGPYEGEKGDVNATYYIDETDANGDGHVEVFQPWMREKYNGNQIFLEAKFVRFIAPNYTIWSRSWSSIEKHQIEYMEIWAQTGTDWMWPSGVTLTSDEGDEASSILTNCNTAFAEWSAKVITGEKSIDTYDTELVPMLQSMNIDRAVELYQAAYDRYMARVQYLG